MEVRLKIVGTHVAGPAPRSLGLLRSPVGAATVSDDGIEGDIVTNFSKLGIKNLNIYLLGLCIVIDKLLFVGTRSHGGSGYEAYCTNS